jgi:ribose transport system substrate-binding protein
MPTLWVPLLEEKVMGGTRMKRHLMKWGAASVIVLLASTAVNAKPFRIAVSNSYIGNEWRVEMINFMQAYATKSLKDKAVLTVNNSGTDAPKQIQVISDMISDGVDAIMINPASDTALDSIIEEACKQNIVVVSFDQGVTAPCAYNIGVDYVKLGEIHAQWMADTLGGKGNVVVNRGVSGFPADKNLYQGTRNVLDKYPGIKIAAEVYGKWDNAVSQQELTKVLTANPNIDGVLNQYGTYGALQALINLNHPFMPMTGQGENGWRIAMLKDKDKGLKGVSAGDPSVIGAYALKITYEILEGKGPKEKNISVKAPIVTTADLKEGVNVFPNLSPTLDADTDIPGANLGLTMDDAVAH